MKTSPTIGKLAQALGINVETIRFYERKGLLPTRPRGSTSVRRYSEDDARKIRFIKGAQEVGFTLKEIKTLLDLEWKNLATCGDMDQRAQTKLKEVELKIKRLQQMARSLRQLSKACQKATASGCGPEQTCRIIDCFEKDWKC